MQRANGALPVGPFSERSSSKAQITPLWAHMASLPRLLLCSSLLVDATLAAWTASTCAPSTSAAVGRHLQYRASRAAAIRLLQGFPEDDDGDGNSSGSGGGDGSQDGMQGGPEDETVSEEERGQVDDFRAQLLRQFLGGNDPPEEENAVDVLLRGAGVPVAPPATKASKLAVGQLLVANPERFCSRNPFSRPVKDLNRFGLAGPIDLNSLEPDFAAQMLPVIFLIDHDAGGSRGLLMERRTGALMGDVSMEDYGCVAISPLWLGGTAKQNSLYVVHDVDSISGATEVRKP